MTEMTTKSRKPLSHYLAPSYPFRVIADPEGGYVIVFPDLPGCLAQVETLDEIGSAAEEARKLWITTEYEEGEEIPPPSYPEEYSGKFQLRLPRSLHRRLSHLAEDEGVSLNQCVVGLLASAEARLTAQPAARKRVSRRSTDKQADDFNSAVRAYDRARQRSRVAKELTKSSSRPS